MLVLTTIIVNRCFLENTRHSHLSGCLPDLPMLANLIAKVKIR
jgi:hypothetical protein